MTMHVMILPTTPVKKIREYKPVMGITMYRGSLTGPRFSDVIATDATDETFSVVGNSSEKSVATFSLAGMSVSEGKVEVFIKDVSSSMLL
jgi:hypothetical protein